MPQQQPPLHQQNGQKTFQPNRQKMAPHEWQLENNTEKSRQRATYSRSFNVGTTSSNYQKMNLTRNPSCQPQKVGENCFFFLFSCQFNHFFCLKKDRLFSLNETY